MLSGDRRTMKASGNPKTKKTMPLPNAARRQPH
jgi:hypothetical protein